MTLHEWQGEWKRLDQFRISADVNRDDVSAEWFKQLRHWHVDAVEHGITKLIGSAKDTFLPGLGLLKDYIQERIDRYDRSGKCDRCGGSGWVDAPIFKSNGLIYSNAVSRCPSCAIPAPQVEINRRREPVSEIQAHEYRAGRFGREQMPEGCQAKHPHSGNPEMKAAFDKLRIKLFGRDYEHTDGAA